MVTVRLDRSPQQALLLARAALPRRRQRQLPDVELVRTGVQVDVDALVAYQRLLGFAVRGRLPSTYLHVLTFPLQLALMARPDFPLPLPGLVHVANRLTLHRPVEAGEPLDLSVRAADLRPHRRGTQVDLVGEVRVGAEPVWSGRSTYLARGAHLGPDRPDGTDGPDGPDAAGARDEPASGRRTPVIGSAAAAAPARNRDGGRARDQSDATTGGAPQAVWRVPADTGRRYASVSGDHNPIHLHPWSARAFGFPRAVAHGMWTAAAVLAWLEPRVPAAHDVAVSFASPVLLPSTVEVRARRDAVTGGDADRWAFEVGAPSGRTHLTGTVTAPPGAHR